MEKKATMDLEAQFHGSSMFGRHSPLLFAIGCGAPLDVIEDLIGLGANFCMSAEQVPLLYAIRLERYDIASLLTHYGAGLGENFSRPDKVYTINEKEVYSASEEESWNQKLKKYFERVLEKKQPILLTGATKDGQPFLETLLSNSNFDTSLLITTNHELVEKQSKLFEAYDKKTINYIIKVCDVRLEQKPNNKIFFHLKNILSLYRPQPLLHLCLNFLNSKKTYREEALNCKILPDELKEQLRPL